MSINEESRKRALTKALQKKIAESNPNWADFEMLEKKIKDVEDFNRDLLSREVTVGPLSYKPDGAICFNDETIKMRYQLKTLCVLLMSYHKKPVDYSKITDELIASNKRAGQKFTTITKYVSELHKLLEKRFRRKVIFNQQKEAYIFDIDRKFKKMNKK